MNFLFFDCESNGLPKVYGAPVSDVDNYPRVIQLAWILTENEQDINECELLIKPDAWEIPKEKFWIDHGFSTEKSKKEGMPLREVLTLFIADLAQADYLVAHNMEFDLKVVGAEFIRYKMKGKVVPKICTMQATIDFCEIPFAGQRAYLSKAEKKYKFPKLSELHNKLFGKDFESAHSAGGDVAALKNCFFELVKIGVISLQTPAN